MIFISKIKRDYRVEFDPISELNGTAKKYFRIPDEVLLYEEIGKYRVALYCYLYIHKGLNDIVNFSVPLFVEWCGFKSDTHKKGINDKVIDTLNFLESLGYVSLIGEKALTKTSCVQLRFNTELVDDYCKSGERFAIVYLDEVERIFAYERTNIRDTHFDCTAILLVFVYLRRSIPRRINEVKIEERSEERILDRRRRLPEAYNGKYQDIAEILGVHERVVSRAVEVLRELELIVLGTPNRIKNIDGEFRTPDFIFANYDKRDRGNLLACGMDYARTEIELKAKKMYEYHIEYGVKYTLKEVA